MFSAWMAVPLVELLTAREWSAFLTASKWTRATREACWRALVSTAQTSTTRALLRHHVWQSAMAIVLESTRYREAECYHELRSIIRLVAARRTHDGQATRVTYYSEDYGDWTYFGPWTARSDPSTHRAESEGAICLLDKDGALLLELPPQTRSMFSLRVSVGCYSIPPYLAHRRMGQN